jgi:integrase
MENSDKTGGLQVNYLLKPTWQKPIPTAKETKLLLNLAKDGTDIKVALCLIALAGLRPIEVVHLKWRNITENYIEHLVYKPTNRICKCSVSVVYKIVRKPFYSQYLKKQLELYRKRCPNYENDKMFPWTTTDGLNKWMTKIRQKVKTGALKGYDFLLDTNFIPLDNSPSSLQKHRISLYSLRRFCLTAVYHIVMKDDIFKTREYSGHTRTDTLLNHYLYGKEDIGVMNDTDLDSFIELKDQQIFTNVHDFSWPIGQI